jgi:TfoX/Sxy family transcriptional regulator of competence genes
MVYSGQLADRLRKILSAFKSVTEKKMFGGLAFLLYGNMCCGVVGDTIMIRTGPELYETILQKSYARTMDFTGRVMRNFVYVDPEDIQSDESLHELVTLTVNFASSLPRKTKSPEDES